MSPGVKPENNATHACHFLVDGSSAILQVCAGQFSIVAQGRAAKMPARKVKPSKAPANRSRKEPASVFDIGPPGSETGQVPRIGRELDAVMLLAKVTGKPASWFYVARRLAPGLYYDWADPRSGEHGQCRLAQDGSWHTPPKSTRPVVCLYIPPAPVPVAVPAAAGPSVSMLATLEAVLPKAQGILMKIIPSLDQAELQASPGEAFESAKLRSSAGALLQKMNDLAREFRSIRIAESNERGKPRG